MIGVRVEWDIWNGPLLLGTKKGVVAAQKNDHLCILVDQSPGDPSNPFVGRHRDSVRLS